MSNSATRVDQVGRYNHRPRHARRLSDKVLIAFDDACDGNDLDVADRLLHVLEGMLKRWSLTADGNRRHSMETLVEAHERLWYLRHPLPIEGATEIVIESPTAPSGETVWLPSVA